MKQSRSIYVDFSDFAQSNYYLQLKVTPNTCLFVDNQLVQRFTTDSLSYCYLPIQQLINNNTSPLITLFHKEGNFAPSELFSIVAPKEFVEFLPEEIKTEERVISQRSSWFSGNDFVFYFVLSFGLLLFVRLVDESYLGGVKELFRFQIMTSGTDVMGYNSRGVFIFAGVVALTLPCLIIWSQFQPSFAIGFWDYALALLFAACFFILKYSLLLIGGYIFNRVEMAKIHYDEFVWANIFYSLLLFLASWILFYQFPNSLQTVAKSVYWIFFIIVSFGIIRIWFVIKSRITVKNIYLFSYICVTELIPLIILVKIYFLI